MNRIVQYVIIIGLILVGAYFILGGNEAGDEASNEANVISGFEDKKVWDISPENGFSIKLSKKHVTQGKHSLEVVYPKWGLPSINTKRLKQDWGNYDYLGLDVYNASKESVSFRIRLDDVDGKRTVISKKLNEGLNKIRIKRGRIAKKIKAGKIKFVVFYLSEPEKRYKLYFDNLHLVKSDLIKGIEKQKVDFSGESKTSTPKSVSTPMEVRKAAYVPTSAVAKKGSLRIAIARLKETKQGALAVSSGIPFAPGQLNDVRDFIVYDRNNQELPLAVKVLARWPQDQSIRSVLVQFKHPIEQIFEYVQLEWGKKRTIKDGKAVSLSDDFPEAMVIMPPEWYCQSQVIGEQVPYGELSFAHYDSNMVKYFKKVVARAKTGNLRNDGYYSTAHVFYQMFVRTGELEYFMAARKELLSYRENDLVHEGKFRGASHISKDVGRYTYIQAMVDDYLLTGDERTLEVAGYMAEFLKNHFKPSKGYYPKHKDNFFTERFVAFPFLGIISYYELTQDPQYLKIADQYMDNLYKTQLEWPSRGGFIHNLYAHDPEEGAGRNEYGGSPFMTGLLLEAIIKYHKITGSEKAADSIFRATDWLLNEGLVARGDSFKYITSQGYLNSSGDPDVNLLVVHALGYAYRLSNYTEDKYFETAKKVFQRGVKDAYLERQKHFNQNYRSSGHYLAYVYEKIKQNRKEAPKKVERETLDLKNKNIFYFNGFEHSLGKFRGSDSVNLSIDSNQTYLNGKSLKIKRKYGSSLMTTGVKFESWNILEFSNVGFAYLIPNSIEVGIEVRTLFGDWICIGGTAQGPCKDGPVTKKVDVSNDGQWHELNFSVPESVHSLLPAVDRLTSIRLISKGGEKNEVYWIDDFRIKR